jgi:hypothetical protein
MKKLKNTIQNNLNTKQTIHKTKKTLYQFKINLGIKNAYLNSVLNLRFYLQTIHKRRTPKKIIMIKIKKNTKIKKKNTYLLKLPPK